MTSLHEQLPDPPKWDPNDYETIDFGTVNKEDLDKYVKWCTQAYEYEGWRDWVLWEAFQMQFEKFTEEAWNKATLHHVTKLKTCLRSRGVYVEMTRAMKMTKGLYIAAHEEEQAVWPQNELKKQIEAGPFHSILTQSTSTPTPDPQTKTTPTWTPAWTPTPEPQPERHVSILPPLLVPETSPTPVPPASAPPAPVPSVLAPSTSSGLSREAANLAKLYTEEQKYSGENDNFEYKLNIFNNACKRAGLPAEGKADNFPQMLKGLALDFFFSTLNNCNLNFDQMCRAMIAHFEGEEYQRATQAKWDSTTLSTIVQKHEGQGKSTEDCLQLLLQELTHLRHGLEPACRSDSYFRNKLISACRGVPACELACFTPSPTVSGFIHQLKSSISTYEHTHGPGSGLNTPNTMFTDRRYHRQDHRPNNDQRGRYRSNQRGKRCFVCRKENCWSTRHSKEERDESMRKFKNNLNRRFDRNPRQYITDFEGTDPETTEAETDKDFDIEEQIETLILDADMSSESEPDTTEPPETFLTSINILSTADAENLTSTLADRAFAHALTGLDILPNQPDKPTTMVYNPHRGRYSDKCFHGIMIDTGAAARSTTGLGQFLAYTRIYGDIQIDKTRSYTFQFGIGSSASIGVATINTPVGSIDFHIIEADIPFILCLHDMKTLNIYLDNIHNVLVSTSGTQVWQVVEKFGHLFLLWGNHLYSFLTSSFDSNPCYLTETELRQLHRRFGHPSANKLCRLLERSGHDVDKYSIEYLNKFCEQCQKHGRSPGRFKFVLRDDTIDFNHSIYVDILYIDGHPVLHIVDEATRFQAARWLQNISAQHTWDMLRLMWIDTYIGPPDNIIHDAGTNFTSKEFRQHANSLAIITKAIPVEAHWSIGIVERYHPILKRAYAVIVDQLPDFSKTAQGRELALQMAVKAVNDTAGPDGLVPTLLVFGAYPKMNQLDPPAPTISQRATAVRKAMEEISKLRATRLVQDALNQRNGPDISNIHDLPIASKVLVWRESNTGQSGK